MKTLSELLHGISPRLRVPADVIVRDVTCDSRKAGPGSLYVALKGTRTDGHRFVPEAVRAGAVAVIAERPLDREPGVPWIRLQGARRAYGRIAAALNGDPSRQLSVIGVTGTNGKTTTAFLVRSILKSAGERPGLIGTVRNDLGGRLLDSSMTTPDASDLQAWLAEMVRAGCRSCVMEVSSHALVQGRVDAVRFAAGIFTNLTRDHLDYHATFKAYREAKARLFELLPRRGVAVLNADDPAGALYASRTRARVVRYGFKRGEVRGRIDEMGMDGTHFRIRFGREEVPVRSHLIGRHNVENMLAAAACLFGMGYDAEPIRAGLEAVRGIPGRLEEVSFRQEFRVFVDYAHTPDALERAIRTIRLFTPGRVIVVFGCGGDRDRGKRPLMGEVADRLADELVLTSDNPRSEDPESILADIRRGITRHRDPLVLLDREAAIHAALRRAGPGDSVLIAGKGHETYQIIGRRVEPFDDREVARAAIRGKILIEE